MGYSFLINAVIVLLANFQHVYCQMKEEKMPDGTTKMSFSTPDLNDDEQHSPFMPEMLKCDACMIISYQLFTRFDKFNELRKYLKYKAPESEVLDMFEETCQVSTFENYGLKTVKGVNRLSGPGLKTADEPGVLAGGGKWPGRIVDMCEQFIGEIGEMEIYNNYAKHPKSRKMLNNYLCHGKGLLGECTRVESQRGKDEL